jgi:hypothetical protein
LKVLPVADTSVNAIVVPTMFVTEWVPSSTVPLPNRVQVPPPPRFSVPEVAELYPACLKNVLKPPDANVPKSAHRMLLFWTMLSFIV